MTTTWIFGPTEEFTATCHCCGREMRQLAGTVSAPGAETPRAFFTAVITPGHPHPRVKVGLVLGDLSESGAPGDRQLVAMEIWRRGNQYVTGLVDAADAMLPGPAVGIPLTADEVRASAWKEWIFSISDEIVRRHPMLRAHLDAPG